MIATAKIFKNGASQAVRLPKKFRFDSDEVCIKRVGAAVLLFPKDAACSLARRASKGVPRAAVLLFSKDAAWDLMGQVLGKVDEDFMADRNQPNRVDARKPLGKRKGKRS